MTRSREISIDPLARKSTGQPQSPVGVQPLDGVSERKAGRSLNSHTWELDLNDFPRSGTAQAFTAEIETLLAEAEKVAGLSESGGSVPARRGTHSHRNRVPQSLSFPNAHAAGASPTPDSENPATLSHPTSKTLSASTRSVEIDSELKDEAGTLIFTNKDTPRGSRQPDIVWRGTRHEARGCQPHPDQSTALYRQSANAPHPIVKCTKASGQWNLTRRLRKSLLHEKKAQGRPPLGFWPDDSKKATAVS